MWPIRHSIQNIKTHPLSAPPNRGNSGAAGTKRGQLLEVKVERYKQPAILK